MSHILAMNGNFSESGVELLALLCATCLRHYFIDAPKRFSASQWKFNTILPCVLSISTLYASAQVHGIALGAILFCIVSVSIVSFAYVCDYECEQRESLFIELYAACLLTTALLFNFLHHDHLIASIFTIVSLIVFLSLKI